MRWLLRIVLLLGGTVLLVLVAGFCWLYFYTRDLPDISRLAQYAPTTVTQASDPCLGPSTAVPYEAIGANVRSAITAVEVTENEQGILRQTLRGFFGSELQHHGNAGASWIIGRTMFCAASNRLSRRLAEFRTGIQLERRYTGRQLFTIFANRAYFGQEQYGVYVASDRYFHKIPADLNLSQAALLVALIRSPSMYSPIKHPDRALRRRNEVIDAMVENGSITALEAQAARGNPLDLVVNAGAITPP